MKHLVCIAATLLISLPAAAQYPAKPIRMIIPNIAGGIDTYVRVFLPKAVENLGQPVVIENRPGASGIIGAEAAARSAPDGYTVLFATSAVMVTAQFLNKNVPFDTLKDFTPINKTLAPVESIVVHGALPVKSVQELIDHAKKNPGKLTYGSSGVGTLPHLNGEAFKMAAGVDILHVPYKGAAQIGQELVAGRIDVAYTGLSVVGPHAASGKVRILALTGPARFPRFPELPSVTEFLPEFRGAPSWFSLFGPAAMPRPVVDRLHGAVVKALQAPEVRAAYDKTNIRALGGSPEELAASMKSDTEIARKLVAALGLKPE